jgi:hypothetical protein
MPLVGLPAHLALPDADIGYRAPCRQGLVKVTWVTPLGVETASTS